MDENLEIMRRLWTEELVTGDYMSHHISKAVMYPKPAQNPFPILIGGYADRVLNRAATSGLGWLTYFHKPDDFKRSWDKIIAFAQEAGKDPAGLASASQLPIMVGASKDAVRDPMMDWLNKEWDFPSHSDCSRDSAILGSVDECVEQIKRHHDVGAQKIIFVPYRYEKEQVEIIAGEIIPRLRA